MRQRIKDNSFIKGAAALSLASLLCKMLGVMYKIPLARLLLDEGMSYFNSAYTVYTFFFILCSAGVPKAITILITSHDREEGSDNDILFTSSLFFFLIGVILSLIFIALSFAISDFIGSRKSVCSMIAIAPSIPFIAVSSVIRGYLNGRLKFSSVALSQCLEAALKLLIGLALARIAARDGMALEIVSAYAISGITVGSIITYLHLLIRLKMLKDNYNHKQNAIFSPKLLRKVCSISLPVTASAALMSLVNIIDLTIVMRSLNALGYSESLSSILYGNYTTLAVPMFNFALSITTSICTSALPMLTESSSKKLSSDFSVQLNRAGHLSAFVAAPAALFFMCFPKEALSLLFESGSVAIGAFLLSVLSPSIILIALLTVINTALEASGRYNVVFITMIVSNVVKLISSFILIGHTDLGLWGAPIGTALSYIIPVILSLVLYNKNEDLSGVFKEFIVFPFAATLSALILICIKERLISIQSPVIFSLSVLAMYGCVYLSVTAFFCFLIARARFLWHNKQ